MKRVLFGVDSFFQFIIATNLRTTVYKDDFVGIIFYSSTPRAKELYENTRNKSVYNEVYYADTSLAKCGKSYSFVNKLPKYFVFLGSLVSPELFLTKMLGVHMSGIYDEFVYNGYGALPECIFNVCYHNNKNIMCKRMEDAYASYFTVYNSKKNSARRCLENISKYILKRKDIDEYVNGYYFSEPSMVMVKMPYPIIPAPKFGRNNKNLTYFLNDVFNYKASSTPQKQIYMFEDGLCFFENREDEVYIIKYISQFIPKESIAVKMHPRRTESRYDQIGVEAIKASSVPWEVIQLNNNYSGCIFLTFSSSAVFSSDIYFGDDCYKILLYKLLKGSSSFIDTKFEAYVRKYRERFGSDYLYIPESYNELKDILLRLISKQI